ncbi:hypothetical protein EMCRGX_G012093 [Ephydatia muelleri]
MLNLIIFSGPPGRPNAVANTIGPDMVLVVVNPSSSGGLPTNYSVTISNSSSVYSNSTPAFLNGSAMVTFTDLTNSTNYTISAVAINCAGSSSSSDPTTIYVSCTSAWIFKVPVSGYSRYQCLDFLGASVWIFYMYQCLDILVPVSARVFYARIPALCYISVPYQLSVDSLPSLDEVFTLKCSLIYFDLPSNSAEMWGSASMQPNYVLSSASTKINQQCEAVWPAPPPSPSTSATTPNLTAQATMNKIGGHPVVEEIDLNIEMMPPPHDPIATPQASSVPPEVSLYDASTQDQRVPEESLYDGRVDPAGNVPTGRGGNVQEALYFRPDTSKKNTNVSLLSTDNRITSLEHLLVLLTGPYPTNPFPDRIRLSQLVSRPYRASSIQSSDPIYCLSSILTVNITAAMNDHSGGIQATTVTVPSNNPPLTDQLTVTWTPPTTGGVPTSYNVTINDSSSPVVIADNGSPVYTHTFTGLVSDTLYTVSVVATNCAGASNGTSETSWTCKVPYTSCLDL